MLVIATPERFDEPRDVGAYLGLAPRGEQSGDCDRQLRISKTGDTYLRRLLVIAAHSLLGRWGQPRALRDAWGLHKAMLDVTSPRPASPRYTVAVSSGLAPATASVSLFQVAPRQSVAGCVFSCLSSSMRLSVCAERGGY